jgi:hypothetical protein
MNPIIQAMLKRVGAAAFGKTVRDKGSLFSSLTEDPAANVERFYNNPQDRLNASFDQFGGGTGRQAMDATQQPPNDRVAAAFDAIRSRPAQQAPMAPPMSLASHAFVNVPDKAPQAPAQPEPSPIGFFLRNAMMQQDPSGGGYLDPTQAQQAQASPFKGLFS